MIFKNSISYFCPEFYICLYHILFVWYNFDHNWRQWRDMIDLQGLRVGITHIWAPVVMGHLTIGTCQAISLCNYHRVHFRKPRQHSLWHTQAAWCSLLLWSCKPVQHGAVQHNVRLNQVQDEMMQSRDTVNSRCTGWLPMNVTGYSVLPPTFFIGRKTTLRG